MKRAGTVAVLLLALAVGAQAQRPAPPRSAAPGAKSFTPSVPPGANSYSYGSSVYGPSFNSTCTNSALIPAALGCTDPYFTPNINFSTGTVELGRTFHLRPGRRHGGFGVPVYGPYYAAPLYPAYPVVTYETSTTGVVVPEEEEPPAPTIFENRARSAWSPAEATREDNSRYGIHYLDSRERQPRRAEAAPALTQESPPRSARDVNAVVLIFRDGHEQEVHNYVIVGNTLYDLDTFVASKIKLADLNLNATMKANEDRGLDFSLPAAYKLN